jgi:uncharacterized repeat protein (TIGR03803 family)
MTKPRALGPFPFLQMQSSKNSGLGKFSLTKMVCVVFVFCAAAAISAPSQTFTTLVEFDYGNGAGPNAPLIQGIDGSLYGSTLGDGASINSTLFKMTPEGSLTTLYTFCAENSCADGKNPQTALVQSTDGNLYGTTSNGGTGGNAGTVFRITPEGKLTTLYSFCTEANCPDGGLPTALLQATDGNFYGTAWGQTGTSLGTVFKITSTGNLTTLATFCTSPGFNCPYGDAPNGLIQATDGNFYGTTAEGGAFGYGTVFKITPAGTLTALYSFCAQKPCADGANPMAGLVQASDGNLYGTTLYGGTGKGSARKCSSTIGCGTVFKITLQGEHTTLYNFCSQPNCSDGLYPFTANLIQATDGKFYGADDGGGTSGSGTVFVTNALGKLRKLHDFCVPFSNTCSDGLDPHAGVFQATNGVFYGTAPAGGSYDIGTLFSLSTGLSPFVTFLRNSGKVGQTAQILGQGFTGATGVSFNGTPASFTLESDAYLTASVPPGATTGSIAVAEPAGTLTSNKIFRVIPQISSFSPTIGPVGTIVVITGDSFTGATEVVFACGKKATFTVDSDTRITATLPAGAMSGAINLVTPGGNVGSTTDFTVTP